MCLFSAVHKESKPFTAWKTFSHFLPRLFSCRLSYLSVTVNATQTKHTLSVFVQGEDETSLSHSLIQNGPQANMCSSVDKKSFGLAPMRETRLQNDDILERFM